MAKASEFERHAVSRRIFLRREKNQFGDSSKKGRCECNFRGGNLELKIACYQGFGKKLK
jgi:hypothetical protein